MENNARLLVHAGASSTRQDDDQRVAQAAAYLNLENTTVLRTHVVWPPRRSGSGSEILQDCQQSNADAPVDDTSDGLDSLTFIDDTQLAYTLLESQLLPSSARTLHPTSTKRRSRDFFPISSTAPTPNKATRVSESPNSRPRSLEEGTRIEGFEFEADRAVRSTEQDVSDQRQSYQPTSKEKSQTTEDATTSNDTTSELPNSYSLDNISDGIQGPRLSERSVSDPGPTPTKQGESGADSSLVSSPGTLIRRRQQMVEQESSHVVIQPPADPHAASTSDPAEKDLLAKFESSPRKLSTSIDPPGPVTSIEPFTTHVTPTLHKLAQNPELSATFQPTVVERSLDVHERGHWEVQCSSWTPELQSSFWKTLETVVGTGKAGRGVWCSRGSEDPLPSQSSQRCDQPAGEPIKPSFSPVRVYCWGEIAKHIYLLLFIASNSKIRKLGLRWVDAQGLVVLQMRAG